MSRTGSLSCGHLDYYEEDIPGAVDLTVFLGGWVKPGACNGRVYDSRPGLCGYAADHCQYIARSDQLLLELLCGRFQFDPSGREHRQSRRSIELAGIRVLSAG